jgi:uncharacterized protein involved in exopolysaccharide biosynthesis
LITAVVAISSLVYSLQLTNYYQSSSLITANSDSQNKILLSQFSGAASLMGVNLPSSGDNKAMEAIELIQSRRFVKHLLTFDNTLPSMMAAKSYDRGSKELLFNTNIYDPETKTWKREPNEYGQRKPSYLEAHRLYKNSLISISQDIKTGFISITIEHISPIFAKEFLELIIREANALLRNRDMEESSQALRYLKSELSKTPLVEIRESINTLIESQLEIQMMAKINEDYILVEIEPPFVPEKKSKPRRSSIVILATIFGGLLSVMIVLVRHYLIDKKTIGADAF